MNLHKDKINFEKLIDLTSRHLDVKDSAIVEKDYYVTYFLQKISEKQPDIIFKGGTSLSKCHKVIDRFSEDIDLTIVPKTENVTRPQRKSLKYSIMEIIDEAGFVLRNKIPPQSGNDINRYNISCNSSGFGISLKPDIIVETSVLIKSFPTEIKDTSSLIYDFLKSQGDDKSIEAYGLKPFKMSVQTLARTLADKLFAIVDYYIDNDKERLGRHIYDIYKILPYVKLDETFRVLTEDVRDTRKKHTDRCHSAQDSVDIQEKLQRIVVEMYYESDYNKYKNPMHFDDVSYTDAITAVQTVIDKGIFTRTGNECKSPKNHTEPKKI